MVGVQSQHGSEFRQLAAMGVSHPAMLRYLTVVPLTYALCCASSTLASSGDARSNGPSSVPSVVSSNTYASSNRTPTSGSEPNTPNAASTRQATPLLP